MSDPNPNLEPLREPIRRIWQLTGAFFLGMFLAISFSPYSLGIPYVYCLNVVFLVLFPLRSHWTHLAIVRKSNARLDIELTDVVNGYAQAIGAPRLRVFQLDAESNDHPKIGGRRALYLSPAWFHGKSAGQVQFDLAQWVTSQRRLAKFESPMMLSFSALLALAGGVWFEMLSYWSYVVDGYMWIALSGLPFLGVWAFFARQLMGTRIQRIAEAKLAGDIADQPQLSGLAIQHLLPKERQRERLSLGDQ